MKNLFNLLYSMAFIYSVSVSAYLGWWILKDWEALDYAHNVERNYEMSLHHRINLAGEGPGFFLCNCLAVLSLIGLNINNKK